MTTSVEQQIRERAFHLWEQDGCPHDRADHHWFIAEREIQAVTAPVSPRKRAPAKQAASSKPATQARTPRSRKPPAEMRH